MDFRQKVVVVTGASSGIGRATALAFARRGANVVGVARREARLQELVQACRDTAPGSSYLAGDLGDRDFAERVIDETGERYGRLDVLVNNAAMPVHKLLYTLSVEEAEEAFRVNFLSCLWTTFAAIPWMLRGGGGAIVNVSSFASKVVPTHEAVYAATKCALNGFSEGLWNDLAGSNIHVSLVHPGPIDTEIWDKRQDQTGYRGIRYPAESVARGILRAVERRQHEVVLPRFNPMLMAARFLRLVCPPLLRRSVAMADPVPPQAVDRARENARAGRRLGR